MNSLKIPVTLIEPSMADDSTVLMSADTIYINDMILVGIIAIAKGGLKISMCPNPEHPSVGRFSKLLFSKETWGEVRVKPYALPSPTTVTSLSSGHGGEYKLICREVPPVDVFQEVFSEYGSEFVLSAIDDIATLHKWNVSDFMKPSNIIIHAVERMLNSSFKRVCTPAAYIELNIFNGLSFTLAQDMMSGELASDIHGGVAEIFDYAISVLRFIVENAMIMLFPEYTS